MNGMAIGLLASATGTKAETIRYYERIGLLPAPARTASNYRSYCAAELARLSFIRRARALGFSIEQVTGGHGSPVLGRHLQEIPCYWAQIRETRSQRTAWVTSAQECRGDSEHW